ncbi:MAG TPA: ATP-binding cassette domain-containing protein [Gaiellaceae bacterium]|nr:ATP-binding cassette domain-containing protein [Gaiellaceae bacterium]
MLTLSHANKHFGAVRALDDCSFAVERGRMVGFLGPNGAGKTTAMRAIFGLVELDSGVILWDEQPVGPTPRLRFGYMPEERGLYPRMPVRDQLAYFGSLHGLDDRSARVAADEWLDRLDLAGRGDARLEELSHGNQQRAQLAATLLHQPELLVLDEPFAGLDLIAVKALAEILRGEAARGAAVLFSSHQLDLVEDICEDVAIIDHGRVVATGAVASLKRVSRRRQIEVQLENARPGWLPDVAGVELSTRSNGRLRLLASRDVDPQRVLIEAKRAGDVVAFTYGPPSLADIFLELVVG